MHPGTKDAAHQKYNSITYASQSVALLLVMLLVELQKTGFPILNHSQGHIWAKMWHYVTPLTENDRVWAKNGKKCTVENCGTTYPKSKNNCISFSSIFHVERPVSRCCRLKLKFLCNQISHCIYSFCSIELTKSRNTWSLTAVVGMLVGHTFGFLSVSLSEPSQSVEMTFWSPTWSRTW